MRSLAPLRSLLLAAALSLSACAAEEPDPEPAEAPPAYTKVTPTSEAAPPEAAPEPPPPAPAQATEAAPPKAPPKAPPPQAPPPKAPPPPTPAEPLPAGTPQVTFVRVSALLVGGDFDSSGDEEVAIDVDIDGATQRLFSRSLDLPDDSLEAFPFAESEWVELPERAQASLHLSVVEEDVTENEAMCGTDRAVVVTPLTVGPTESSLEVPLSTIRGESSGLFQATRRFVIEGPSVELSFLRVQRRDAADAEGRRLVAEAFAGLDQAAAPESQDQVQPLRERMTGWTIAASQGGARSTHTWARKTLAGLSEEADELLTLLTSAEQANLADVQEKRAALARALEAVAPADRRPALEKVVPVAKSAAGATAKALTELQGLVEAAQQALGELGSIPAPLEAVSSALDEYAVAVDQALAGALAREEVPPKLKALQAHVATATR